MSYVYSDFKKHLLELESSFPSLIFSSEISSKKHTSKFISRLGYCHAPNGAIFLLVYLFDMVVW